MEQNKLAFALSFIIMRTLPGPFQSSKNVFYEFLIDNFIALGNIIIRGDNAS